MQNAIQIFKNPAFGEVRTIKDENNNPWFAGKDVATILGYKDASRAIFDHVDEEDKTSLVIQQSGPNYKAKTTLINESGHYALILASKLPQAKAFKHWVTAEVLPSIRKEGGYIATKPDDTPEVVMARAIMIAKSTIDRLEEKNKELEQKNHKLTAKAEHLDKVVLCDQCYTTTQIAKELGLSAIELNQLLLDRGVQFRQSRQYMLYADYARLGLAKNRTAEVEQADGSIKTFHPYLVWTEKGRVFLHNLVRTKPDHVTPKVAIVFCQPSLFSFN